MDILGKPDKLLRQVPQLLTLGSVAHFGTHLVFKRLGVLVPAPVHPRALEAGVVDHLCQALASFCLGHIPLGDVFLKDREEGAEEGYVVAEEVGFGDAAGVEACKGDLGVGEALAKLTHGKHVADLYYVGGGWV